MPLADAARRLDVSCGKRPAALPPAHGASPRLSGQTLGGRTRRDSAERLANILLLAARGGGESLAFRRGSGFTRRAVGTARWHKSNTIACAARHFGKRSEVVASAHETIRTSAQSVFLR